MELRALTWNLFHGRDYPPDPALHTLALAPAAGHRAQRHPRPGQPRPASPSSPGCSSPRDWDVALLQECPPRWAAPLAAAPAPTPTASLTSRNSLGAAARAARPPQPRPDRLQRGRLEPDPGPGRDRRPTRARAQLRARRPERRTMAFTRPGRSVSGRGLRREPAREHRPGPARRRRARGPRRRAARLRLGRRHPAGLRRRPQPAPARDRRLRRAARALRPRRRPAPDSIDHLLVAGLEIAVAARRLATRAPGGPPAAGLAIRALGPRPGAGNLRRRAARSCRPRLPGSEIVSSESHARTRGGTDGDQVRRLEVHRRAQARDDQSEGEAKAKRAAGSRARAAARPRRSRAVGRAGRTRAWRRSATRSSAAAPR